MFILHSYGPAVIFCIITMLCWGSWANTQKLAGRYWRFELFYWDYAIGVLVLTSIFALTLGSFGSEGRHFIEDLSQAEWKNIGWAWLGGAIFNLANILLVAAISIAGMAVAFPVGIGMALVCGVIINYVNNPEGNAVVLFLGVAIVALAIVIDALAYRRLGSEKASSTKGIVLSIACGVFMSLFYFFVISAMSLNFSVPETGKLTPYTAIFIFSLGLFMSNLVFNTIVMKFPFEGEPVKFREYFKGTSGVHLTGILGGIIWGIGMSFSIIAAEQAGPAISYGLGQGATMIAALWGVFVWKEFAAAPRGTNKLLTAMFVSFIVGLSLIVYARTAAG